YVGGDFMEYRFFVPLFPIAFVACELGLRRWAERAVGRRRWAVAAVGVLALAAVATPIRLIPPFGVRWHLAAEHTFYRVTSLFPLEIRSASWMRGKVYGDFFRAIGVTPRLATGVIGMVGYLTDLPIVDSLGLTNARVGRLPVKERGRPGHERVADLDTLLEEEAVLTTDVYWPEEVISLSMGIVDGVPLLFLQYDEELLRALARRPGAILPDPEADIGAVLAEERPLHVLEAVHAFYERFLRRHPDRDLWLDRIRSAIEAARATGRSLNGSPPRGRRGANPFQGEDKAPILRRGGNDFVPQDSRRQSGRDRGPGDPDLPGDGHPHGRGLLGRGSRRAARPDGGRGGPRRSGAVERELPAHRSHPRGRPRHRGGGHPPRLRLPLGAGALRRGLRGRRPRLHRPAARGDLRHGRQDG